MLGTILMAAAAASTTPRPCMRSLPEPTMKQVAFGKDWYFEGGTIEVFGKAYQKYGLPRVLRAYDVDYGADYNGVAIGLDPRVPNHEVIYLLVNAEECEFQPYQRAPEPAAAAPE